MVTLKCFIINMLINKSKYIHVLPASWPSQYMGDASIKAKGHHIIFANWNQSDSIHHPEVGIQLMQKLNSLRTETSLPYNEIPVYVWEQNLNYDNHHDTDKDL